MLSFEPSDLQSHSYQSSSYSQDNQLITHDQMIRRLLEGTDIIYHLAQFNHPFSIQMSRHSCDYKIMQFWGGLGYFSFPITVIQEEGKSRMHYFDKHQYKYSSIYATVGFIQNRVTKCFELGGGQNLAQRFAMVLKEYCFAKLMGALKIGPKVYRSMGFDIVVFQECIQFTMKKCSSFQKSVEKFDQSAQQKLVDKLNLLHSLKIVHKNIKISNLVYDSNPREFLFADFGDAECLKQSKGKESVTQFAGSIKYCSSQMRDVFYKVTNKADLYENDNICLNKVFDQAQKKKNLSKQKSSFLKIWSDLNKLPYDYRVSYLENARPQKIRQDLRKLIEEGQSETMVKYKIWKADTSILINFNQRKTLQKYKLTIIRLLQNQQSSVFRNQMIDALQMNDKLKKQRFFAQNAQEKQKNLQRFIVYGSNSNLLEEDNRQTCKIELQIGKIRRQTILRYNQKIIALNPQTDIPQNTYFYHYLRFIDFRSLNSSFSQKMAASKKFIERFKPKQIQHCSQYKEIQLCLKYILNNCNHTSTEYYCRIVPTAIINLVIIDGLYIKELLQIIKKTINFDYQSVNQYKVALMLFQLYFVSDWIRIKAVSTYQNIRVHSFIDELIVSQLKKLIKISQQPLTILILKLIQSETNNFIVNSQFIDLNLPFLQQFKKLDKQQLNRIVVLMYLNAIRQVNDQQRAKRVNQAITKMSQFDQKLVYRSNKVEFYHLRIYYLLKQSSLIQFTIYTKLKKSFSQQKLFQKYLIFYEYQRQQTEVSEQEQLPKAVPALFNLSVNKIYKFSSNLIKQWLYWLKILSQYSLQQKSSIYERVVSKLRQIYSKDDLLSYNFFQNENYLCPAQLLDNIYQITILYCHLFSGNLQSSVMSYVLKLFQQFNRIFSSKQLHYIAQKYQSLVKGQFNQAFGKSIQAFNAYKQEIENIQKEQLSLKTAYFLVQFLMKTLDLGLNDEKNISAKVQILQFCRLTLKTTDIGSLCLRHKDHQNYLRFLKYYPLIIQQKTKRFVLYQMKITEILSKYHNLVTIQQFCEEFDQFLTEFKEELMQKWVILTKDFASALKKYKLNQFSALQLCILIKQINKETIYTRIICVKILMEAQKFTIRSKSIIFGHLRSYLYLITLKKYELVQSSNPSKDEDKSRQKQLKKCRFVLSRLIKYLDQPKKNMFKKCFMIKRMLKKNEKVKHKLEAFLVKIYENIQD